MSRLLLASTAALAASLASTEAPACYAAALQRHAIFVDLPEKVEEDSVLFNGVPVRVRAEVAVDVTVTEKLGEWAGLARVNRVLKGKIDGDVVRVIVPAPNSCDKAFFVGEAGIVVGQFLGIAGGISNLFALSGPLDEYVVEALMQRSLRERGRTP